MQEHIDAKNFITIENLYFLNLKLIKQSEKKNYFVLL